MFRPLLRTAAALLLLSYAAPVRAAEKPEVAAPSAAVAAAWAQEGQVHSQTQNQGPSSRALTALYGSYGALSTLDMASTIKARNAGAREVNPMMDGGYGQASATKLILAAATVAAVKMMEKKNKKAAFVTMIALNAATAAVVANNYRNAHAAGQR
jgi:hypothetical protein